MPSWCAKLSVTTGKGLAAKLPLVSRSDFKTVAKDRAKSMQLNKKENTKCVHITQTGATTFARKGVFIV